jgi:GT2 family glycosyltransferase
MRPLPIDRLVVRVLDRLLRLLPRRRHEALIQPLQDVTLVNAGEREWRATGVDPAFLLTGGVGAVRGSAWFYVEGYLRKRSTTLTKLYFDTGAGYSEDQVRTLPVTRRGYVREVIELPTGVRGLRLDPTEAEGDFIFEWMDVQAIGVWESRLRRLGRVLFDHNRFAKQDETRAAAKSGLFAPLLRGDLRRAYAQSAAMRIPAHGNESCTELWRGYQARLQASLPALRAQAAAVHGRPLISVIVPTYNTSPGMLRAMLDSVLAQVYTHWELVVWDDASPQAITRDMVARLAAADRRVRALGHGVNAGVSRSTNAALRAARGDYVVLLDHDDQLEPQALLRVAQCAAAEDPDFAYSDEVIVTAAGDEVLDFALRPAFSLEYFRHHPYIVHLLAFRRQFLLDLGGLDESLRISQDVDLILRAAEKARRIAHIPELLYRWRMVESSAGHARQSLVSATTVQVLQKHIARCGETAVVEPEEGMFNYYRPRYAVPANTRVAVIIPTKNHHELVRQCVQSLERTTSGLDIDLVIVNHDSDDPAALAYFDSLKSCHTVLRHSGPFNFSAINNAAVRQLGPGYTHLLFCNNDIEALEHGWLHTMLGLAGRPGVGIVGAHLIYGDRIGVQHAGVGVGMFGAAEHFGKFMPHQVALNGRRNVGYRGSMIVAREVSAVTAACLLIRSDCFMAIGGYDEDLVVGFGDIDLCLRAGALGWGVVQSGGSVLIHHESRTRGTSTTDPHPADSALYVARWKNWMEHGDPYFHPLFSEASTAWLYRSPLPVTLLPQARVWPGPARPTILAEPPRPQAATAIAVPA